MKPVIINQDSSKTTIKCPECGGKIECHHGCNDSANDCMGRLDLGQQNYLGVVCMNQRGRYYCDFAKNVHFK